MTNDDLKVNGKLKWDLIRDGKIVESGDWRDNVVTTNGKNSLSSLLNSASAGTSWVTHMGFGTSSTAVANTDTILGAEMTNTGYARVSVTRSVTNNVITYTATLTNVTGGLPVTIQEAGLFNAVTTGTLIAHQLTGAVTLQSSSDSLQVTWQVTMG